MTRKDDGGRFLVISTTSQVVLLTVQHRAANLQHRAAYVQHTRESSILNE